jgi:hypothetical protein
MKQTSLGGARQRTAKGGMVMVELGYKDLLFTLFGGAVVAFIAFILIVPITALIYYMGQ